MKKRTQGPSHITKKTNGIENKMSQQDRRLPKRVKAVP